MLSDFNFWNYLSKDASKYETTDNVVKKEVIENSEIVIESPSTFSKTDTVKEWGNYILDVGKRATNKAAQHVSIAAKQIRQNVAEIGIIEESNILSKFSDEQTKFVEEKRLFEKKTKETRLPWIDVIIKNDGEQQILKTKILSISTDERNFMRNPPPGGDFEFNYELHTLVARILLTEDINLSKMRFKLVPKKISEEIFWRNYFYRVFLIKQSLQSNKEVTDNNVESVVSESLCEGDGGSGSNVSDSVNNVKTDNVRKEEKVLVSEAVKINTGIDNEEWEAELQKELSEFELINEEKGQEVIYGDDSGDYDDLEREILNELKY